MKSLITVIAFLSCFIASAQTNQEKNILEWYKTNQTGIVSTSGRLAIVYTPPPYGMNPVSAKEFDASKPIYYQHFSTTNVPSFLYILRPEYQFHFFMLAENGDVVEPTRQGAKYGRLYDDLKTLDWHNTIGINNRGDPMRDIAGIPDRPGTPFSIPSPDDLFKIPKPGKYTLTIQAACFASREWPPQTNYDLIKLPPVRLTIIKREDEKH